MSVHGKDWIQRVLSTYLLIASAILWSGDATIAGQVMTVLGPISPDDLGVTLMHDHIAFAYPGWFADESVAPYDRDAVEAKALKFLEDIKSVLSNLHTQEVHPEDESSRSDRCPDKDDARRKSAAVFHGLVEIRQLRESPEERSSENSIAFSKETKLSKLTSRPLREYTQRTTGRHDIIVVGKEKKKCEFFECHLFRS